MPSDHRDLDTGGGEAEQQRNTWVGEEVGFLPTALSTDLDAKLAEVKATLDDPTQRQRHGKPRRPKSPTCSMTSSAIPQRRSLFLAGATYFLGQTLISTPDNTAMFYPLMLDAITELGRVGIDPTTNLCTTSQATASRYLTLESTSRTARR